MYRDRSGRINVGGKSIFRRIYNVGGGKRPPAVINVRYRTVYILCFFEKMWVIEYVRTSVYVYRYFEFPIVLTIFLKNMFSVRRFVIKNRECLVAFNRFLGNK